MGKKEIRILPAMGFEEDYQGIDRLDVTLDALLKRWNSLIQILVEKGGLSKEEATEAVNGFLMLEQIKEGQNGLDEDGMSTVFKATEIAAIWARKELAQLREFEREVRADRS